jgi:hypothetical protein
VVCFFGLPLKLTTKHKKMNKQEFLTKYGFQDWQMACENDMLMVIAANLSDVQHETTDPHVINKMNVIKKFIFDYTAAKSREALNTQNF